MSSLCEVLVNVNPCFNLVLHRFNDLSNFRCFQVEPSLVEFSFLPVRSESHIDGFCGQSSYGVDVLCWYLERVYQLKSFQLAYFDNAICQVLTFAFWYTMHLDIKFPRILFWRVVVEFKISHSLSQVINFVLQSVIFLNEFFIFFLYYSCLLIAELYRLFQTFNIFS